MTPTSSEAKVNGTSKVEPAISMTLADTTVAGSDLGNHGSNVLRGPTAAIGDGDLADDGAPRSGSMVAKPVATAAAAPTPNRRAAPAAAGRQQVGRVEPLLDPRLARSP